MNDYELGTQKIVPATLIYVKWRGQVLMLHRKGRTGDYHEGKWNGLGGKFEKGEDPLDCARRELREESGLDLPEAAFRALGIVQFPNFKPKKNEDWWVCLFVAHLDASIEAPVLINSNEGELHWVPQADLLKLNLWAGDLHFIPAVIDEKPVFMTLWYEGERVIRKSGGVLAY